MSEAMQPDSLMRPLAAHALAPAAHVVLDLETGNPPPEVIDAEVSQRMAEWTPPGNVKAADKIAEKRAEAERKARERAALMDAAPVLCLALRSEREARLFDAMTPSGEEYTVEGWRVQWCRQERALLLALRDWLNASCSPATVIAGHNINGFDVPKLRARYLAHRLRLPWLLAPDAENPRCDTMREFPRHSAEYRDQRFVSLDAVCKSLGIPRPKQVIDGGDCPGLYQRGEYAAIGIYCCIDVMAAEQAMLLLTDQHPELQ